MASDEWFLFVVAFLAICGKIEGAMPRLSPLWRWPAAYYGKTDDDAVIDLPPLLVLPAGGYRGKQLSRSCWPSG